MLSGLYENSMPSVLYSVFEDESQMPRQKNGQTKSFKYKKSQDQKDQSLQTSFDSN